MSAMLTDGHQYAFVFADEMTKWPCPAWRRNKVGEFPASRFSLSRGADLWHLHSRAAIHRPRKLQVLAAFSTRDIFQHARGPMEPGEQVTGGRWVN